MIHFCTKKLVKIDLDVPELFGMFKGRFNLETAISKTKPKFYLKLQLQQRPDAFEKIVKLVLGGVLKVLNAIEAVAKKFQELLKYMENICDKIFHGKDTLKDICNAGIGPDGIFRGFYMKFLSILDYIAQLVIKVKQKVAKALGIAYQDDILIKISKTKSQVFKKRFTRFQSDEIFTVQNEPLIKKKHILLVDDIVTTGATLENCALQLLKNNTEVKLSLATIAIA